MNKPLTDHLGYNLSVRGVPLHGETIHGHYSSLCDQSALVDSRSPRGLYVLPPGVKSCLECDYLCDLGIFHSLHNNYFIIYTGYKQGGIPPLWLKA